MPGVDPPWDQPQETQYCRECERLVRELAIARELLTQCQALMQLMAAVNHRPSKDDPLRDAVAKFLSTSRVPGLVAVKSEDLELAIGWINRGLGNIYNFTRGHSQVEYFDQVIVDGKMFISRLKSALKGSGRKEG